MPKLTAQALAARLCERRFLCAPHSQHFLLAFVGHLRVHVGADSLESLDHLLQASWVEGGLAMTFEEILDQAMAMPPRRPDSCWTRYWSDGVS